MDFITKFIRDKIPNIVEIRVPMGKARGTTLGLAFVELYPGLNVKDILKQVNGLKMGVRSLKIAELLNYDNNYVGGVTTYRGGFAGGNSGDGSFGGGKSVGVGATLYVGGLPQNASEEDIKSFLQDKIPSAENVRVPFNRDENKIKGMAFVQLSSGVNVQHVLSQIDGLELDGRRLKINESKPREGGRPSGGGQSGGFIQGNSGGGGFGGGNSGFGGYSDMTNHWHSENVEAEILSSHDNAEYRGKICVIKTVFRTTCSVWIISADQTISVLRKNLKPSKPQMNHKVV